MKSNQSDATFLELRRVMNEFFKWFTIAQIVEQIVQNFVQAGGPSINPLIVANEASKEIVRKAANGFIPQSFVDGHKAIIQAAINAHPEVQNHPDDSTAAVLD